MFCFPENCGDLKIHNLHGYGFSKVKVFPLKNIV